MSFEPESFSYSHLSLYLQCPRKWELSQALAIPVPFPWAMFFGRCCHEAWEEAFRIRLKTGLFPSLKEITDVFSGWWDGGITEAFFRERVNFSESIDWSDNDPGELKDLGVAVVQSYIKEIGIGLEPILVAPEIKRKFMLKDGDFKQFVLHPDLITTKEIIDWKTASRPWGQKRVDEDLQATCYLWGSPGEDLTFAFHVVLKQIPPELSILRTRRSQAQLDTLEFVTLPYEYARIQKGEFPRKESYLCKWCGYSEICE